MALTLLFPSISFFLFPPHHKCPGFTSSPLLGSELAAQCSYDLWITNSSNDGPTVWLSSPELLWHIWNNTRLISSTKGVWKSKAANCHQCSRWQTLTHAVYVQTQLSNLPVSLVRSGCMKPHQVIKGKKIKKSCSSLEAMSSCMQFLAWLTACCYQPAAMDVLGFDVEKP